MKANRKFLNGDDEAVSPVIAVILMVAITVVLAATVYVWVSGFGSGGGNTPAHTMALTSAGAITNYESGADSTPVDPDFFYKPYTVASADPSLTWGDLKVMLAGAEIDFAETADCTSAETAVDDIAPAAGAPLWTACSGTDEAAAEDLVNAGDTLYIDLADADGTPSGSALNILDRQANSVMLTLTVR